MKVDLRERWAWSPELRKDVPHPPPSGVRCNNKFRSPLETLETATAFKNDGKVLGLRHSLQCRQR